MAPSLPGNWSLSFDEEFNASLDNAIWANSLWDSTTFAGNSQIYMPNAVSSGNGMLSLTAKHQTVSGYNYVSGLVDTGPAFGAQSGGYSFKYGYVQATMKLPSGQGLWPAFWMVPEVQNDILNGEIDIMEADGSQPTVDQVHFHQNGAAWGKGVAAEADLSQGFHTYAVNWQPGKIDWYLDGGQIYSLDKAPSEAEYLILNLATGVADSWPGAPSASTTFPSSLQVENVQVWQATPEPTSAWVGMGLLLAVLQRRPSSRTTFACSDNSSRPHGLRSPRT